MNLWSGERNIICGVQLLIERHTLHLIDGSIGVGGSMSSTSSPSLPTGWQIGPGLIVHVPTEDNKKEWCTNNTDVTK